MRIMLPAAVQISSSVVSLTASLCNSIEIKKINQTMCLITKQKKAKIAKEDFIVYKEMQYGLMSPYTYFQYKLGEVFKTTIRASNELTAYDQRDSQWLEDNYGKDWNKELPKELKCIGQGFHSCLSVERVAYSDEAIYKCIVPKGSKYFLDATGLCVSNQIVIKRRLSRNSIVAKRERSVAIGV